MTISQITPAELQHRPIRIGIYATIDRADQAVEGLLKAGFDVEHISVICSEDWKAAHFQKYHHQDPAGAHTVKAAALGGAVGAMLGGLTTVTGIVATGDAELLAAGPVAAWAGGIVGGLVGAMMTRGIEGELANFYDQAVAKGKILVAAEASPESSPDLLTVAEQVFEQTGAEPLPLREG